MAELEQELLLVESFRAGSVCIRVRQLTIAFVKRAQAEGDGLSWLKGVAAIQTEGEVAVAVVYRGGGKVEGFNGSVAPAFQRVAPTAAAQGGISKTEIVVMFSVVVLVESRQLLPPTTKVNVIEAKLVISVSANAAKIDEREDSPAFFYRPVDGHCPIHRVQLPNGLAESWQVNEVLTEPVQLIGQGFPFMTLKN